MDTLQIQDSFTPYYAEPKPVGESRPVENRTDRSGQLSAADVRKRLQSCRQRLARAIDQSARH